jgi:hypothetical protein
MPGVPGDDEQLSMSMRKYLKEAGLTSQQAIEKVARRGPEGKGAQMKVVPPPRALDSTYR